jgi:hypothetical protein
MPPPVTGFVREGRRSASDASEWLRGCIGRPDIATQFFIPPDLDLNEIDRFADTPCDRIVFLSAIKLLVLGVRFQPVGKVSEVVERFSYARFGRIEVPCSQPIAQVL